VQWHRSIHRDSSQGISKPIWKRHRDNPPHKTGYIEKMNYLIINYLLINIWLFYLFIFFFIFYFSNKININSFFQYSIIKGNSHDFISTIEINGIYYHKMQGNFRMWIRLNKGTIKLFFSYIIYFSILLFNSNIIKFIFILA
jgi:hypothetical protein